MSNEMEAIKDVNAIMDIADFFRTTGKHAERNYIMFLIGIYTGLRIGDILSLRVRDVKEAKYIELKAEKTDKKTKIIINDYLKAELEEYIKDKKEFEYLIKSQKGRNKPIGKTQAWREMKKAANEFGLDNIGCHTLRKTFGYFFYQQYGDIVTLKNIFGHSDISVTFKYIGLNQDKTDKCVGGLKLLPTHKKKKR
ncbi:integrase [Clostridium botulinum]|uniref:Site-specific integrase n=1 Tax=Clostridium botulinum TaxID=1491 RepID=A0A6M0SNV9_CLOBO|nr:tyrosine-type recombinase/integrase [Clostridium botulinum]ACD53542.1 site-specific recombinase, phage integrase family [Clostridium botulinum E3 str. Alaska E43]AJF29698.1 integrase [Clostridium botulinum]AJF32759.1 integrase [Clostridium botulinum]MBY6949090.1 tyrosine-type recombinase/integrase [Clostridium botulinum]MBY7022790.1 tyrosine-type recombinase/integrase [Clostridium botulinum]